MPKLRALGGAVLCWILCFPCVGFSAEVIHVGYVTGVEPAKAGIGDGSFERSAGQKIEWRRFDNGAEVVRALAAGDLDIANLGSSVVAVAAGRQLPIETFLIASQLGTSEALLSLVGTHVLTLIERILGMAIEVTRLSRALGAIVHGVDISQDLPQYVIDRLGEVLVEHQVLFFRDQPITPEAQCRFAAKFGSLHIHPIYPVLPELPEIMLIDTHEGFLPDNDNWHTDVTFSETPPLAGILAAKRLPPLGGDTLWSSSAAAYDALSEPVRRFLQGLTAQHSVAKSFPPERWQNDPEFQARYERAVAKHPPVNHPVVRTHPVSGRKGLFVNEGFTTHINELKPRESQTLLSFLFAHVAQPEFTVRWRWSVDDIAFWDNRITQHYAIADYLPERRTMHRATVIGDKPV